MISGIQLFFEYSASKELIQKELRRIEKTFSPTLTNALFIFDEDLINVTIKGILENPVVEGIEFFDDKDNLLRSGGSSIIDREDASLFHSFDLIYNENNFKVGTVRIYSDSNVILKKIESSISLILINTFFETTILFLVIVFFLKKFLADPMRIFSDQIRRLDTENLKAISIDYPYENELTELQHIFNYLINNLRLSNRKLKEHQDALEKTISDRTKELSKANTRALSALKTKSEFLANMSHEIRTPLNGIIGMAQLLEDKEIDSESKEYISTIKGSSDVLLTVINDILDFSKIEAGKLTTETSCFDLHLVIIEVTNLFQRQLNSNFVRFDLTMTKNVPKFICTDQVRLKQILINLISNAVKFTTKGKVALLVDSCVTENSDNKIKFVLSDTGIGISEDAQEGLFDSFTQADSSTTRKYGGSGLGLSISKSLVELLGGTISIKSTLEVGSTFSFNILTKSPSEQDLSSYKVDEIVAHDNLAKEYPLKILVAEDNLINQKIITKFLNKLGYEIDMANNGFEAINMVKEKKYNLIFMDMQMPEMDGIEATIKIRQERLNIGIQIVAMTANVLPEDRQKCFDAGMNDFMPKPVKLKKLREILIKIYELA